MKPEIRKDVANQYITRFIQELNQMEDEAYLEARIAYWAAPTLAEKKPATLLNFTVDARNTRELWICFGKGACMQLGLQPYILREDSRNISVLFYHPALLKQHLEHSLSREYLLEAGYDAGGSLEEILGKLKKRFQDGLPHEIGIFLGIPVHDVRGFIAHQGKACLLNGYWKVYAEPAYSKACFREYDKARMGVALYFIRNAFLKRRQQLQAPALS